MYRHSVGKLVSIAIYHQCVHHWGVQLAPIAVCKHGGVDETPIRGVLLWPYTSRVFAEHPHSLRSARTPKVGCTITPHF